MIQKLMLSVGVLSAVLLGLPAFAGSAHFIKNLSFASLDGDNLACTFKEAGLEEGTTETVFCRAYEEVTYECVNGGGKNPAASNKQTFKADTQAEGQFPVDQNGNIEGTLFLGPISPAALNFSCPPGQDLTLVSVSYSQIQLVDTTSGATLGLHGSFTFTDPDAPQPR